ncbi:MAG: alanine--tRNA ligase [Patescibacteria group bacterium]|jgi:alanyl-tRNA synthetase
MNAQELRHKYLEFFKSKGHMVIPSAPLVPANDPTVLFTTAGMHPLVPFLMGEIHPAGKRLVSVQRCIRTGDIDDVGDDTHLTFFEMLGNWSLGDYFKKEAIEWSWEFLTNSTWLGLNADRILVTVFAGDEDAPRDDESAQVWQSLGMPEERIYYYGKEDNWWGPAGQTGPCGPDTEMFFDTGKDCSKGKGNACEPNCGCGRFVEIWNNVFMQYHKTADGKFEPLKQTNVDTGMGVERTLAVVNGQDSVYQTELLVQFMNIVRQNSVDADESSIRVIVDHVKAAVFLIADGVVPSNKERGYVLRRLIRKSVRLAQAIRLQPGTLDELQQEIMNMYNDAYPELFTDPDHIIQVLDTEVEKFAKTLGKGLKIFKKELESIGLLDIIMQDIINVDMVKDQFSGQVAFDLYQTYGFPKELILEELKGIPINEAEWQQAESAHKDLSRKGAEQKFAGGLADHSDRVVRMHTATHLLHQALNDVLGDHVQQKGSNITDERLRFDFTHPQKVTPEELKQVEQIVNEKIQAAIPVEKRIISLAEARAMGATGLFGEKYGETVSVYLIGDYSKEFCGGPHVTNTKDIGQFKIQKEEASSAGIRRIKATVE